MAGMDLLDRVAALTDDQLRMVAERDDASGVLASYRLAERRGLPYPDRETVVICDGYVIVAQDGEIHKIPTFDSAPVVAKIIREEGGQFCVYSQDGTRSFGCYDSLEAAQERLGQIHSFDVEDAADIEKATKREDGEDFPAEAFAYVPDPDRPSTWKLRLWDSLGEKETRAQVGRAVAALGPDGFMGNRVQIPAEDLPGVKRRVLAAWRKVNEPDAEVPPALKMEKETFKPPQGVQEAAQRALEWISEGLAGSGFTDVGRARAAQLARGDAVSEDVIRRIASYLARHEGDRSAEGFSAGEDGFPSPGRVAWDAWGGDPALSWSQSIVDRLDRSEKAAPRFLHKEAAKRFTLGPLYVPDFMDAHGEWTDAEELQQAVWGWVASGDRTIYLQHDREVRAGEWVEVMTMPQPWTVQMMSGDGQPVGEVTYPAGTVFLGVIWDEGPWRDILAGRLRGYSIGGFSDRVLADLPEAAARDGVSMED